MSRFETMWEKHTGYGPGSSLCDEADFRNQCAMRIGHALRAVGVDLSGLKTCRTFSGKYASHNPGHVRSAQEVANRFYKKPGALGASKFTVKPGTIQSNMEFLKARKGMIFIENGWGSTDHIDLWRGDGTGGKLRGGPSDFHNVGRKIYLWELQ